LNTAVDAGFSPKTGRCCFCETFRLTLRIFYLLATDDFVPSPVAAVQPTPGFQRFHLRTPVSAADTRFNASRSSSQRNEFLIGTPLLISKIPQALDDPKGVIVSDLRLQFLLQENQRLTDTLVSTLKYQRTLSEETTSLVDEFETINSGKDVVCDELETAVDNLQSQLLSCMQANAHLLTVNNKLQLQIQNADAENTTLICKNEVLANDLQSSENEATDANRRLTECSCQLKIMNDNFEKEEELCSFLQAKCSELSRAVQQATEAMRAKELDHRIQLHTMQQTVDKANAHTRGAQQENSRLQELLDKCRQKFSDQTYEFKLFRETATDREEELAIECQASHRMMTHKSIELEQALTQLDWERTNAVRLVFIGRLISDMNPLLHCDTG
jgi:chromosome segregation ATPase